VRKHFSKYIEQFAIENDDFVFITGDLGYKALEGVAQNLGNRFINAGVAEQNMIGMAAGMAYKGFRVLCYSIAPFIVYRCLEQIRNDVCFHDLPVTIVGNGGGYGYGIMGSSHHTLDDIACLSGLPNITCYIPAFLEDMNSSLDTIFANQRPAYLRLGLGKNIPDTLSVKEYGAIAKGSNVNLTIIVQGPVANNVLEALRGNKHSTKIDLFVLNKMPVRSLPDELRMSIERTKKALVVEEHITVGGLGSAISLLINEGALPLQKFVSLRAEGYPNGLFGSQTYHYEVSGLDSKNISKQIDSFF